MQVLTCFLQHPSYVAKDLFSDIFLPISYLPRPKQSEIEERFLGFRKSERLVNRRYAHIDRDQRPFPSWF